MQIQILFKKFFLSFSLFCLSLCFFTLISFHRKNLEGFFTVLIDSNSVTDDFFAKLKNINLNFITKESLDTLYTFKNNNTQTYKYFTKLQNYQNWFFTNDLYENIYVQKNLSFMSMLKLYFLLYTKTDNFYIEENLFFNFFIGFITFIFFVVLLFCLNTKKKLFSFCSLPFLVFNFFSKSFICLCSSILILYSLYFYLIFLSLDSKNFRVNAKNNILLLIVFLLGLVLPFFTLISSIKMFFLFLITLAVSFNILLFFVDFKEQLKPKKEKISLEQTVIKTFDKKNISFLQNPKTKGLSLFAVLVIAFSFLPCFIFKSKIKSNVPIRLITTETRTKNFSKKSFFKVNGSSHIKKELVDLSDFVKDCWLNTAIFFSRVDEPITLETESAIYYNDYVFSNGKITEVKKKLLEFNDDFISEHLDFLSDDFKDQSSVYSIMLAEQGFASFNFKNFFPYLENDYFQVLAFLLSTIVLLIIVFMKKPNIKKKINLYEYQGLNY